MPKLSEEERNNREAARKAAAEAQNRAYWQDKLTATKSLKTNAGQIWQAAFDDEKLGLRELWLILGVFEMDERTHLAGKNKSCRTRWFDGIAPRADGRLAVRGISGFTVRAARKALQFLETSGNGYVYLTDLGIALVQHLRETYAELSPDVQLPHHLSKLEVPDLGTIPAPRWRWWKD
jgi:hypothetical protein